MYIRLAKMDDLPALLALYAHAREQMKRHQNPHQWGDHDPSSSVLQQDIRQQQLYVILSDEQLCGAFAFVLGEDPTYQQIEEGHWLNSCPYGTIHRLASNDIIPEIFATALRFCEKICANIRIDTHKDNMIMQHLIQKHGFTPCGVIYVEDGTPRIAYQRDKKEL